jgi:prefoldin subunit 5
MENSGDAVKGVIKDYNEQPMSFGDKFAAATQGAVAFAGALTSVKSIWNTLSDDTATGGEKIEATLMGLSSAGMQLSMMPWSAIKTGITGIGTALGFAETAALGVGAAIVGLGAAAAIAIGVFAKWAIDMYHFGNTAEGALEKTKEATQGLKEQAESTRQEVESLRSSFDNYQSVVDTLNNCKKGTEEWDKALQDVNSTVMGMMTDPNLLSVQGLFKNEDGHLSIDEDLYKQQIEKKESAQQSFQAAAARSQAKQSAIQAGVDLKNYQKNNVDLFNFAGEVAKKGSIGALATNMNDGKAIADAVKTLTDGAMLSGEQDEELAEVAKRMGTSLESLMTEITTTAEKIKNANTQLENLKQINIAELSKGTKYEDDEKGQERLAKVYDDVIQKRVDQLTKDYNYIGADDTGFGHQEQ